MSSIKISGLDGLNKRLNALKKCRKFKRNKVIFIIFHEKPSFFKEISDDSRKHLDKKTKSTIKDKTLSFHKMNLKQI